jgi:hypothetical protein
LHYPIKDKDGCSEFSDEKFNGEHLKEGIE